MKYQSRHGLTVLALLALSILNFQLSTAHAQGTAFTYQGRLNSGGAPANGSYDIAFSLFATNTSGVAIAGPVTNSAVPVTNGLFATPVDFGNAFSGTSNWLAIAVSTNGANAFTNLAPRQQLTPVPYAEFASSVSGLTVQPNGTSPNVILGYAGNYVAGGVAGATIGGGGENSETNSVTGAFGTVGGGAINTAGPQATVGGGTHNSATGMQSTIAGGYFNVANGNGTVGGGYLNQAGSFATIGGGYLNIASGNGAFIGGGGYDGSNANGNTASGNASVIGGGSGNQATNGYATVAGGVNNTAGGVFSTVAGGNSNFATDEGTVAGGSDNQAGILATIGGGQENIASGNGAFIGGGGYDGNSAGGNTASGGASVVGGGLQNTAGGLYATVAGGAQNNASSTEATIGGGYGNTASAQNATVGGGGGNQATSIYAMVGGGNQNHAGGIGAFIGGGGFDGATFAGNNASGNASVVAGGLGNQATTNYATVGGGYQNIASGIGAFVGGGGRGAIFTSANVASGPVSFVGGGLGNQATNAQSAVVGGNANFAGGVASTVGGGQGNIASATWATVPGGATNVASGQFSFAAGQQAQATNQGAFVWADSQSAPFVSVNNDSFNVRAQGGAKFVTSGAGMTIDGQGVLTTAAGALTTNSGLLGLTIQQNPNSPNVILGYSGNYVAPGNFGSTIGGGGATFGATNSVFATFGTVSGGEVNQVVGNFGTVGGGQFNSAATNATVAGGVLNHATGFGAFIGGGGTDGSAFSGNMANGNASVVAGGLGNQANSTYVSVVGGRTNVATGVGSVLVGGENNSIPVQGVCGTIGGGSNNVVLGAFGTVPGGANNFIGSAARYSFAAGQSAEAANQGTFVWADSQGGVFASTANDQFLIRAQGGVGINITNPAESLTIGNVSQYNSGLRLTGSSTLGTGMAIENTSSGGHKYDLISSASGDFEGPGDLAFYDETASSIRMLISTNGNVGIGNYTPGHLLVVGSSGSPAYCDGTTWQNGSDRNSKEDFTAINPAEVLQKVAAMPITQWQYKIEPGQEHIGPMAQDFHEAFGLNGGDDKHISTVDEGGVALAAIQGLNEKVESGKQKAETQIQELKAVNAELKARLEKLEQLMNTKIAEAK